ncbi:MAG: hypothetical protein QOJ19_2165, partial [Acidimicrobiia bacterium]|nr:hypothetical protein [Acidimicrobiia bacterium]
LDVLGVVRQERPYLLLGAIDRVADTRALRGATEREQGGRDR